MMITGRKYKNCLPKNANGWPHRCRDIYARSITCLPMKESPWTLQEHDGCYLDTVPTIPNQSTACWPLSSHQHCFSYLLGKWCFLVPKNSFTEYFSRFLFFFFNTFFVRFKPSSKISPENTSVGSVFSSLMERGEVRRGKILPYIRSYYDNHGHMPQNICPHISTL